MARKYSSMMALGTLAPSFSLIDVSSEKRMALSDIKGTSGTLVMFICNHCPFVIHLQHHLSRLGEYAPRGLGIAAVSANDASTYPADSPKNMKIFANENSFSFPYLYDEDQSVAKAYGAVCTPDFFLFDNGLECYYRGRFDESTPGASAPVTGIELRSAIENLLSGTEAPAKQYPSIGCSIKWK